MTTDYLTIEGDNRLIYRIEKRNKLDGSLWELHINRSEPLRFLLNEYKDNDMVEWRIKNFNVANAPHKDCEL